MGHDFWPLLAALNWGAVVGVLCLVAIVAAALYAFGGDGPYSGDPPPDY